jgi:hypothetical protein
MENWAVSQLSFSYVPLERLIEAMRQLDGGGRRLLSGVSVGSGKSVQILFGGKRGGSAAGGRPINEKFGQFRHRAAAVGLRARNALSRSRKTLSC